MDDIVRRWEEAGTLAAPDMDALADHCAGCRACTSRYAALLACIARDVRETPLGGREAPAPGLPERVMSRIGRAAPARRLSRAWIGAAAACVLIALGAGSVALWHATQPPTMVVRFELASPGARSVALVGSFTGWNAKVPMTDRNDDGVWEVTVRLKRGSIYTYNFVIDGQRWILDPNATAQVNDGFGGLSSVIRL